jgi:hypothetical protein
MLKNGGSARKGWLGKLSTTRNEMRYLHKYSICLWPPHVVKKIISVCHAASPDVFFTKFLSTVAQSYKVFLEAEILAPGDF